MILCISANPGLDRRVRIGAFSPGEVNRAEKSEIFPGGKAAHVAMAARALGLETTWFAFLGGAIGKQCAAEMQQLGINVAFVQTQASTRVNLEIIEDSGRVTELLEPGGTPTSSECEQMRRTFSEGLHVKWKKALVVISGSLPQGVSPDFYNALIEEAHAAECKVFVDTSGDALRYSLQSNPDLVKPNRNEAEALLQRPVRTIEEAQSAVAELISLGAQSAAVTLGSEGILWQENKDGEIWAAHPPKLRAMSTVGCGDATLAGFAYGFEQGWHGEDVIRFAASCGAANCRASLTARIDIKEVESIRPQVRVTRLTRVRR